MKHKTDIPDFRSDAERLHKKFYHGSFSAKEDEIRNIERQMHDLFLIGRHAKAIWAKKGGAA